MMNLCDHYNSRKHNLFEIKIIENITIKEIEKVIDELSIRFRPNNYDVLKNNCQMYVRSILMELNRLKKIKSMRIWTNPHIII